MIEYTRKPNPPQRRGRGDFTPAPRGPHGPVKGKIKRGAFPKPPVSPKPPKAKVSSTPRLNLPGEQSDQSLMEAARRLAQNDVAPGIAGYQGQRQQILDMANQKAGFQTQVAQAIANALGHLGGDLGGEYRQAAHAQYGYGKGFAQGMSQALASDAGAIGHVLESIGAPGDSAGGDLGAKGTAAADYLYGTGGEIPGDMFIAQSKGIEQEFGAFPQQAINQGARLAQQILGAAQGDAQTIDQKIAELQSQIPGMTGDFYLKLLDQQQGQQEAYARAHQPTYREIGGSLYAIDPATGETSLVIKGPGAASKPPKMYGSPSSGYFVLGPDGKPQFVTQPKQSPERLTFKNINGRMVGVDPYTGQPVVDLGVAGTPKKKGGASKPIYRQGADGRTYQIDPKTNTAIPVKGLPGKQTGGARPPTATAMRQARQLIPTIGKTSYYQGSDQKPLTSSGLRAVVSQYNSIARREGNTEITLANVAEMTPEELAHLGLSKKSATPQDVYLQMVQLGVPARQAWTMIRRKYPKWGEGYFKPLPKGEAVVKGRVPKNQAAKYIVGEAEKWLGTPYSWGGGGPGGPSYGIGRGAKTKGFDCSGFIEYLYSKYGIEVGGVTYDQIKHGYSVKGQYYQPGDLIFFGTSSDPHHVGMYIGGGKFIESPYTGGHIQITPLSNRNDIVDVRRIFV